MAKNKPTLNDYDDLIQGLIDELQEQDTPEYNIGRIIGRVLRKNFI